MSTIPAQAAAFASLQTEAAGLRARLAAAEKALADERSKYDAAAQRVGLATVRALDDALARLVAAEAREARLVGALRDLYDVARLLTNPAAGNETRFLNALSVAQAALTTDGSALAQAMEGVLIGGNHLVSHLGQKHPPHDATDDDALAYYGAGWRYDAWAAWSRIMRLRAAWRGA